MSSRTTHVVRKKHRRILAAALLAFATASCSGASTSIVGASGSNGPASMQVTAGDAQVGTVGATLPSPISVEVTTKSGKAVSGTSVDWTFANGTGSTTADGTGAKTLTTVTDKSGVASVYWTLDTIAGDQEASASLHDAPSFQTKFHSHGKASRPDSIDVSPSSVILAVGQPVPFKAQVFDRWHNLISDASVAWHSDDPAVAVVDSTGVVTGAAPGRDTIIAKDGSASGASYIRVASSSPSVAKVTADSQSVTLSALGATARLSATATDASGTTVQGVTFQWTSLNSAVATVDSAGLVTAVKNGTTSVLVSAVGSTAADTVAVSVSQKAAKITMSPDSLDLQVGQTGRLTATVADKNGNTIAGAPVAWHSDDSLVAVVDSTGVVTAEKAGADTITATSGSALGESYIKVASTSPSVAAVTVSPASLSFTALGGTATLTAKASDALGNQVTGASISWSSSNPAVASVDQGGVVTSRGWGQAFVVATAVCCAVSDTAAVTVQQPAPTPVATGYYGEVFNADALSNIRIGYSGIKASYRFRAEHTGDLNEIRMYMKYGTGYSAGNGGQMKVEVETDDGTSNHFPSGTVIATSNTITDPLNGKFRNFTFSPAASLTKGQLYHLVFMNPAPDAATNYTSIDDLYNMAATPNMQPTVSDTDLAVLLGYGGGWSVRYQDTPIVDIRFSDGFIQGQGYIAARINDGNYPVTNTAFVRERFTVTGTNRVVTSVHVRLRSVSGDGRFTVRLEDGNGTLIEQGTATASTKEAWQTLQFQSAHELVVGSTYDVVLSAPAGNQLQIYVLQQGAQYGLQTPTQFFDGNAQYYDGSWNDAINGYMDFQLYFTVG